MDNYQKEIYKINDNLYIILWHNFLKIYYNIDLCRGYKTLDKFVTSTDRINYEYVKFEDIDKYDFKELTYDKNLDIYKKPINVKFPYPLLNVDYNYEFIYRNEDNEWYLLKATSYDTNLSLRCQQGEYKEYKLELSYEPNNGLIMRRNLTDKFKYENIYDDNYKYLRNYKTKLEKIETNNNYQDPILNILFSDKFPLYFYPSHDYLAINKILNIEVKIQMIKLSGNKEKLIMDYADKQYYYAGIHWNPCCGSGTDSFILLNNEEDMKYFNYDTLYKDSDMQKHFEYLKITD